MSTIVNWLGGLGAPMLWSLATMVLSCLGLWIQGYSPRVGWWYGLSIQLPWALYGIFTDQWGLIGNSIVFSVLYVRNLRRNRGRAFTTAPAHCPGCACQQAVPA